MEPMCRLMRHPWWRLGGEMGFQAIRDARDNAGPYVNFGAIGVARVTILRLDSQYFRRQHA
jgi:hypothetical protein